MSNPDTGDTSRYFDFNGYFAEHPEHERQVEAHRLAQISSFLDFARRMRLAAAGQPITRGDAAIWATALSEESDRIKAESAPMVLSEEDAVSLARVCLTGVLEYNELVAASQLPVDSVANRRS